MNRSIYFIKCLLAVATMAAVVAPFSVEAQDSQQTAGPLLSQINLGYYSVLSAEAGSRGAVTCTDSSIFGNVGSSGARPAVVLTRCALAGHVIAPVSATVLAQFNNQFDQIGNRQCQHLLAGTLAGVTLAPGVYCFAASASVTGTLTLNGPSTGVWTFQINGNLTGKSFSTVMAGRAKACNVYWESSGATTMTTSNVKGNVLAGQAITMTGGSFVGRAFAKKAVTMTDLAVTGCG